MFMIKETFVRQVTVLLSSLSLLFIVVLASGETGRGDIRTLTAFAETNAEVAEAAEAEKESIAQQEKALEETEIEKIRKEEAVSETDAVKEKLAQKEASAVVPCSQEDYQILLRIVQAEAGICDDRGKVLVANVILNRVRNEEFPDTIKDVVYQRSQFSPVANGTINTCKVTQQTIDCVNRALSGEDYSQGALYFMNRSGARQGAGSWFDGRLTFLFQHEKHEFFK